MKIPKLKKGCRWGMVTWIRQDNSFEAQADRETAVKQRKQKREVNKIKIIIIDDKCEERERAKAAVEAAGHEAMCFADLSDWRNPFWKQMEDADGVITDLHFHPHTGGDEAQEVYEKSIPPMGLLVALHALHLGKPVVICTDGYHHGPELSFVFDAYVSSSEFNIGFGWEENKDWAIAVKMLETGEKNPWALRK